VIRCRARLRSITLPSSTRISGSPVRTGRSGRTRKFRYEKTTVMTAIVEPARIRPVREKSFWVTPCWTMSPITTRRITSNGSSVPEREDDLPVRARLADRARLDRVDRDPFGPAGIEDEGCLLQLAVRDDVEPRLEVEAAPQVRRRVDGERGRAGGGLRRSRPL